MVPASSIRVGDYITDRGIVNSVRYFAGPVASNHSASLPKGSEYFQHVSNEVNSCYSMVVDRVVVETTFGTYCFLNDTLVSVVSSNFSLKAAA